MTKEEFLDRLDRSGECWLWQRAVSPGGYGRLGHRYAHRIAHELFIGPIPDGYEVDHVVARGCEDTRCCRPSHLEAVTQAENVRRNRRIAAQIAVTACPQGHPYTPENTYIVQRKSGLARGCRRCNTKRSRAARRVRRERLKQQGHTVACTASKCTPRCHVSAARRGLSVATRTDITKLCSACRQVKPASAFAIDRYRPDGLTYRCRSCNALARMRKAVA